MNRSGDVITMSWEEQSERKCQIMANSRIASGRAEHRSRQQRTDIEEDRSTKGTVRWARVQELQLAIATGTYRVSMEEVAESMMRLAKRHDRIHGQRYSA